jgi:hypothetical protein
MKLATPQVQPQKSNGSIWLGGSSVAREITSDHLADGVSAEVMNNHRTFLVLGGSDALREISIMGPGCAEHRRDPPGPGRTSPRAATTSLVSVSPEAALPKSRSCCSATRARRKWQEAGGLLEEAGSELFVPLGIRASPSWWSRARKPHGAPERGVSVAGPIVRIHLPPAGSMQTFDSCVHPLPRLETRSGIGRTRGIDASNPAPSSATHDALRSD